MVMTVTNFILPIQLVFKYLVSWKLPRQLKLRSLALKSGSADFCTIVRHDKATNKIELVYELCIESF